MSISEDLIADLPAHVRAGFYESGMDRCTAPATQSFVAAFVANYIYDLVEDIDGLGKEIAELRNENVELRRQIADSNQRQSSGLKHCGIFQPLERYVPGQMVTFQGSTWHCQKETSEYPGKNSDWLLIVKRGRDGRDGKDFNAK